MTRASTPPPHDAESSVASLITSSRENIVSTVSNLLISLAGLPGPFDLDDTLAEIRERVGGNADAMAWLTKAGMRLARDTDLSYKRLCELVSRAKDIRDTTTVPMIRAEAETLIAAAIERM